MSKLKPVSFRDDPYVWLIRAVAVVVALTLLGLVGGWLTNKATGAEPDPDAKKQLAPTCTINGDANCDQLKKKHKKNARKFRNGDIRKDNGFKPANTWKRPKMVRRVMIGKIEAALRKADTRSAMHRTDGMSVGMRASEYRTQAKAAWRHMVNSATCVTTGQPSYPALPNECRSGNEPGWTKRKVQALGAVLLCGGGVMSGIFTGGSSTAVVLFGGSSCAWGFWSQMDPG